MIIGLTGISGSGKSLAAGYFKEKGFSIIDFDLVAREVVEKDSPCLIELCQSFGKEILDNEGNLNRKHLGQIVFADGKKLEILNSITHKYIMEKAKAKVSTLCGKDIILDAPLLFEAGLDKWCDYVVCVVASPQIMAQRIMERDGIDQKTATDRINARNVDFVEKSHYVVENDGSIEEFYEKLNKILKEL